MNVNLIGSQIAKFRKTAGMTQEELGKAVGVSTQAVSRWERGGAPDVTLMPSIADALGVTIDVLFGREGGAPEDMEDILRRWLASVGRKQALHRLTDVLWKAYQILNPPEYGITNVPPIEHCEIPSTTSRGEDVNIFVGMQHISEEGLAVGTYAQDLSAAAFFPEPEEGYARYLDSTEHYRRLFSALVYPNALEVLLDMASEESRLMVPAVEAQRLGLTEEAAAAAMEALGKANVLDTRELELPDGVMNAYSYSTVRPLIPLLYFARFMGQPSEGWYLLFHERKKPWLRKPEKEEKHEKQT